MHSIEHSDWDGRVAGDSIRQRRTRTTTTTTTTTMAIGDSKEDLSAFSREDLVYKAKLAEQAERYVTTMRCARDVIDLARGFCLPRMDGSVGPLPLRRRRRVSVMIVPACVRPDDRSARRREGWTAKATTTTIDRSDEWIFDDSRTLPGSHLRPRAMSMAF
jgi:hypothetical protein